ncbi:hypothetical protein HK405_011101, partial [Cladochytrium tenue]
MTDLIAIATQVMDMGISELLAKDTCKGIIRRLLGLQEIWLKHPDWPCKEHVMRVLVVFAAVARIVEHMDEDAKMWNLVTGLAPGQAKTVTNAVGKVSSSTQTANPTPLHAAMTVKSLPRLRQRSGSVRTETASRKNSLEMAPQAFDGLDLNDDDDSMSIAWMETSTDTGDMTVSRTSSYSARLLPASLNSRSAATGSLPIDNLGSTRFGRTGLGFAGDPSPSASSPRIRSEAAPSPPDQDSRSVDSPVFAAVINSKFPSRAPSVADSSSSEMKNRKRSSRQSTLSEAWIRAEAVEYIRPDDLQAAAEETLAFNVVMEMTLDGYVTYISPSIRTVLGYEPQDCVTISADDSSEVDESKTAFLPPGATDSSVFADATAALLADDKATIEVTYQARSTDGSWFEMEAKRTGAKRSSIWLVRPVGFLDEGDWVDENDDEPRRDNSSEAELSDGDDVVHSELLAEPTESNVGLTASSAGRPVSRTLSPVVTVEPASPAESGESSQSSLPTTDLVLCRICERLIPAVLFEKHNDCCQEVHRCEMEINMLNEALNEHRSVCKSKVALLEVECSKEYGQLEANYKETRPSLAVLIAQNQDKQKAYIVYLERLVRIGNEALRGADSALSLPIPESNPTAAPIETSASEDQGHKSASKSEE